MLGNAQPKHQCNKPKWPSTQSEVNCFFKHEKQCSFHLYQIFQCFHHGQWLEFIIIKKKIKPQATHLTTPNFPRNKYAGKRKKNISCSTETFILLMLVTLCHVAKLQISKSTSQSKGNVTSRMCHADAHQRYTLTLAANTLN